jgi:hypothetical protein
MTRACAAPRAEADPAPRPPGDRTISAGVWLAEANHHFKGQRGSHRNVGNICRLRGNALSRSRSGLSRRSCCTGGSCPERRALARGRSGSRHAGTLSRKLDKRVDARLPTREVGRVGHDGEVHHGLLASLRQ